jgi:vacuolar protein sorting-associated protein 13A/C
MVEDNLLRLKPGEWKYFYWSDINEKEYVTLSFFEQGTGVISGWSGLFKISGVCEIALKIKNPGVKDRHNQLYTL